MKTRPSVDVIVLSWDRTADTIEAIESALAQRDVDQRVLVLDQGSRPEHLTLLRNCAAADPRIVLREMTENTGVARGRNLASDLGNGEYIVALDNDAIFADDRVLARTVETFAADPTLGAVAFRIFNYFTGDDDEMCWDYPEALRPRSDTAFEVTRYIGAGHALRRDVFYQAGCYDEKLFFTGEERDLGYRILNLGYHMTYIPHLAVRHKVLPGQRVRWETGRYYFTVRNARYTDFKFGRSLAYMAKSALSLSIKGASNGIAIEALRGIRDAVRLALEFRRELPESRVYRLDPGVLDRIRACERIGRTMIGDLRRPFQRLPGRA
jgi:GT2 family glycosyltransferase